MIFNSILKHVRHKTEAVPPKNLKPFINRMSIIMAFTRRLHVTLGKERIQVLHNCCKTLEYLYPWSFSKTDLHFPNFVPASSLSEDIKRRQFYNLTVNNTDMILTGLPFLKAVRGLGQEFNLRSAVWLTSLHWLSVSSTCGIKTMYHGTTAELKWCIHEFLLSFLRPIQSSLNLVISKQ